MFRTAPFLSTTKKLLGINFQYLSSRFLFSITRNGILHYKPVNCNWNRSFSLDISKTEIEEKVIFVCSEYDKIYSNFMKDLGLDSLDHVEVIMEIENAFRFNIPITDAEKLHTPRDIVEFICDVVKKSATE